METIKNMENFFYEDLFCGDLEDLMLSLDIDEESLLDLDDDWSISCEEATLEKIFVINKEFATDAIIKDVDKWEERFPEDSDDVFKKIEKAINEAIDIDKLNNLLPSLYYPNGKTFEITKDDLIDFCS